MSILFELDYIHHPGIMNSELFDLNEDGELNLNYRSPPVLGDDHLRPAIKYVNLEILASGKGQRRETRYYRKLLYGCGEMKVGEPSRIMSICLSSSHHDPPDISSIKKMTVNRLRAEILGDMANQNSSYKLKNRLIGSINSCDFQSPYLGGKCVAQTLLLTMNAIGSQRAPHPGIFGYGKELEAGLWEVFVFGHLVVFTSDLFCFLYDHTWNCCSIDVRRMVTDRLSERDIIFQTSKTL